MVNLLTETVEVLALSDKRPADVLWVGSKDGKWAISWQEFAIQANVGYDDGYGGANVAEDLVIVGADWWLERGEYDGSEWWEYKSLPVRHPSAQAFEGLMGGDRPERKAVERLWA